MGNLTPKQTAQIVALLEDGQSQQYVADFMKFNQSSGSWFLSRYRETGGYNWRQVSGVLSL